MQDFLKNFLLGGAVTLISLCAGYYSHYYFEKPIVLLENDQRFTNIYKNTYKKRTNTGEL
jgi:peptidoglycan/LPS O-acetylase OafA/YrhL